MNGLSFFGRKVLSELLSQAKRSLLLFYRKLFCDTMFLKDFATSGWTRKELSVVLGTKSGNLCDFTVY